MLQSRTEFSFLESNIHGNGCGLEKPSQSSYVITDRSQSIKLDRLRGKQRHTSGVLKGECEQGHAHTLKHTSISIMWSRLRSIARCSCYCSGNHIIVQGAFLNLFVLIALICWFIGCFLVFQLFNCKEHFSWESETTLHCVQFTTSLCRPVIILLMPLAHCRFSRISPTLWEGDKVYVKKKTISSTLVYLERSVCSI